MPTTAIIPLLTRIADSLERMAPPPADPAMLDDLTQDTFLWQGTDGRLLPIPRMQAVPLDLLKGIDRQIKQVMGNTRFFAHGLAANNVMLWGARGMGKSSLVKACLMAVNGEQRSRNQPPLALIEIPRDDLSTLPQLLALLRRSTRRVILFCDDLSFETQDADYKSLKSVLDGGIAGRPDNVLVYATSNRRHLMPQTMIENESGDAINPGEAIEEKVSLSDRFGLWIGLYGASQPHYLSIIDAYAADRKLPIAKEELHRRALQWSIQRGSRSGRVASQFITALSAELAEEAR
ncbi:ATP-binding protein [Bombella sp. TMW 2.2559]|uniref:ATP-binding protein n=1 Tax=Bombella dulcis TaxID=2967339 RepID=A0ABT3WD09_9PROT|nr:ATP-binding protein [Bombella dulcis]MCX5615478.1 ATP-binding protein [Bombella dulcis]